MFRPVRRLFCLAAFASLSAVAAPSYEYALVDAQGETKTQADFPDQYQLIAFGFTHCPDVCPTTLYDFKQVLAQIDKPERLQPIFITIDPKRDTADILGKYTGFFDKRILALVGSREAIDQTVKNFNASYGYQLDGKKIDPDALPEGSAYVVYHSTLIYLLDREGKLLDVFDYQSGAKQLVAGIEKAIAGAEAP
ncbi:MAG: SCO family protein [Cardiobacteriaceae bacterium]|nr:SCO family protein [Cardiobacteriaceae bacterium]